MTIHDQTFGMPELEGKTVLVRVDIETLVTPAERSRHGLALARAIGELTSRRARVILLSHRGEPGAAYSASLSLRPLAIELSQAIDKVVTFIPGRVDGGSAHAIATVAEGGVGLLENLAFAAGEARNDPEYARELASLGHYHINASEGAAPRASTHAIANFMPSYAMRGEA